MIKATEKIIKANRLYNFISKVNQMIVHTSDENTLFKKICEIAIAHGQFKMAWIGMVDEKTQHVLPITFAGEERGYLNSIKKISTASLPEGMGPTGTAIREGKHIISHDITNDPNMIPWREEALARGYHSSIALPIKKSGIIVGSFTVYAAEKHFFDTEETTLLSEAAEDISFGLEIIHREKIWQNVLQELQSSNSRFEMITQSTNDALWEWNFETGSLWGNNTHQQLYGLTMSDPVPSSEQWIQRIHPNDRNIIVDMQTRNLSSEKNIFISEYRFRNAENIYLNIYDRCFILRNEQGHPVRMVGSMMDVTNQKKTEEHLKKEKGFSDAIINNLPGIFYLYDEDGKFIRWNKNFETISGYSAEEITQMHPLEFIDADEKDLLTSRIQKVFASGLADVEAHLYTKHKEKIPYYFNAWSSEFENKRCLIGVGIDITERKKAEILIQNYNIELRSLSTHLQSVREEERLQIARDIHDEMGQQLTGLKLGIEWLNLKIDAEDVVIKEKVKEMTAPLKVTIQAVKRILSNLRPGMLDDLGLVAALQWQSLEAEKRFNIIVNFTPEIQDIDLPIEISTTIYRIYQETLTNSVRHSGAHTIFSSLKIVDSKIILEVKDNGKGPDILNKAGDKNLWLLGIKERTFSLGGTFDMQSEGGKGTTIKIEIPV